MTQARTSDCIRLRPENFSIRRLGEAFALFDLTSGKTHVLESGLALVFHLLIQQSPKSRDALIAETAQKHELLQDDIEIFVDQALHQLQDIGLVDFPEQI